MILANRNVSQGSRADLRAGLKMLYALAPEQTKPAANPATDLYK